MNYKGRQIDPVKLFESYVDFPDNMRVDKDEMFLTKVVCPNPAHDTLKKHFQINAREPMVHCFARCGIEGSYDHAIALLEGLYEKFDCDVSVAKTAQRKKPRDRTANEKEQLRRADRARRQAHKLILKQARGVARISHTKATAKAGARTTNAVSETDLAYETFLPAVALEYLTGRGITGSSVSAWGLGWLPDEKRIVIPGRDENGRLRLLIKRGITARQIPKYLYTEGYPKSDLLFGACQIDLGMVKSSGLILQEGSLGTILNHQDDLRNTTAILGTGISEKQCRIIDRIGPRRIYLMFDKDSAGVQNIEIAAEKLRKYPLYVVRFPKGKDDWDKISGKEKHRQIERALPLRIFRQRLKSSTRKEISFG
jgi:hypothetical protein